MPSYSCLPSQSFFLQNSLEARPYTLQIKDKFLYAAQFQFLLNYKLI